MRSAAACPIRCHRFSLYRCFARSAWPIYPPRRLTALPSILRCLGRSPVPWDRHALADVRYGAARIAHALHPLPAAPRPTWSCIACLFSTRLESRRRRSAALSMSDVRDRLRTSSATSFLRCSRQALSLWRVPATPIAFRPCAPSIRGSSFDPTARSARFDVRYREQAAHIFSYLDLSSLLRALVPSLCSYNLPSRSGHLRPAYAVTPSTRRASKSFDIADVPRAAPCCCRCPARSCAETSRSLHCCAHAPGGLPTPL